MFDVAANVAALRLGQSSAVGIGEHFRSFSETERVLLLLWRQGLLLGEAMQFTEEFRHRDGGAGLLRLRRHGVGTITDMVSA